MNAVYIHHLKKPCANRNIELVDHHDGTISLDGQRMYTMGDCDRFVEALERRDFQRKEQS